MKYKYIEFRQIESNTKIWGCYNRKSGMLLGTVEWYGRWNRYLFSPDAGIVFTQDCLENIIDFIKGIAPCQLNPLSEV